MGKIIAIGGGEIGRPGTEIETFEIDRESISLTQFNGKKKTKVLFIPTASNDSAGYIETVQDYFGNKLGCIVDSLCILSGQVSREEIRSKILTTDMVYVGGGNTLKLMTAWRKYGVDSILREAHKQGVVLSGVSAGAICWFQYGNSDSRKFTNGTDQLIRVTGIGLFPFLLCPHYDTEIHRQTDLMRMMKTTHGIAIALENRSALEIIDQLYRIIGSGNGYACYYQGWVFHKKLIEKSVDFRSIHELLQLKTPPHSPA